MVQIIEQVNGILSELLKAEIMERMGTFSKQQFEDMLEAEEQKYLFYPEQGNVAFASAIDCWSFTLPSFMPNVAKKLGMNAKALM